MKKALQGVLILMLLPVLAFAQNGTIKGVVTDKDKGEALYGVNIVVKGTTSGTSTGLEGEFEISLPSGPATLVFTYLGYETNETKVDVKSGETTTLDIKLSEEGSFLETVVVSATKFDKPLGEQTVSLDVIKPSFIENQNLITVQDAIKRNPGVNVIDGQVNIRGGSGYSYGAGTRVLILLDDLPILQADAGFPNWSSIPMENVGQIEIIKGAASALYGSSAMNGIINIRTAYATNEPVTKISVFSTVYADPKKELDENGNEYDKRWWDFGKVKLSNDAGVPSLDSNGNQISFNRDNWVRPYQSGITIGHRQKFGKFDLVLGAQAVSQQDWKFGSYENRGRVSVQTRYRVNERINFGLNGNVQGGNSGSFFLWNGYKGVNKYLPLDILGEPTTTKAFRVTIDPFFTFMDDKGNKHKILGRWFKVDNDNANDQGNFSNYFYGEYQYQKNFKEIDLNISTGVVASYVTVDAPLYGGTYNGNNFALYAQLDKKFFNKLNVSAGIRAERNKLTSTKAEMKPVTRLGLNFQAAEFSFIRASFGQGYRFPTIAEKFIQTSLGESIKITSNPGLVSETGLSAELGFKQGIKIGKFGAYLDVAGFYNQYTNMMEFNPVIISASPLVVGFQSQNVGNTQIYGIETSLQGEGKLFNKFPATAVFGYTYIVPLYKDFDPEIEGKQGVTGLESLKGNAYNVLKYRFRHTFTGAFDINFKGVDFGITGQYFSFMENIDQVFTLFIPGVLEYRQDRLKEDATNEKRKFKGDFILDLRAGYTFIDLNKNRYKVSFQVKNVLNKEYSLRPGIIEAPLNYTLRLDFEF